MPPTKTLDARQWHTENRIAAIVVGLPTLGALGCGVQLARGDVSRLDLGLFLAGYVLTMLGITLALHRHFSHGSFDAPPWVRAGLAILATSAFQGPIIRWVADHRRHHQYTDQALDPHSPLLPLTGRRPATLLRGLWRAHAGWFFHREKSVARFYAPDLLADPLVRFFDRTYFAWGLGTMLLPGAIAGLASGSWSAAATGVLWGGLLRVWATQQAIWGINSWCHTFGRRDYDTPDTSRNVGWMSVLTLGEGWHNTHHAFPASPRVGFGARQPDPTWWAVRALQAAGLATPRATPDTEQRIRKQQRLTRRSP